MHFAVQPLFPTMSTTTTTPPPPVPKFGGVEDLTPWVGGPPKADFSGVSIQEPITPYCMRSSDARSKLKGYAYRTKGMDPAFKQNDKDYTLAMFADDASAHMREQGMDTCFYFPDPADNTKVIDVFSAHSRFSSHSIRTDLAKLIAAGGHYHGDKYMMASLEESGVWLMASLDKILQRIIQSVVGPSEKLYGPTVWMEIVAQCQSTSLRRVQVVVEEFKKLTLKQFAGENVDKYCEAARTKLSDLERNRQLPSDVLTCIIDKLVDCSVEEFRITFITKRVAVEAFLRDSLGKADSVILTLPNRIDYRDLLREATQLYRDLIEGHRWGPANGKFVSPEKELAALKAEISDLKMKSTPASSSNTSTTGGENRECFICKKKGHLAKDCPQKSSANDSSDNKKSRWVKTPPADGAAETISKHNNTFHWCARCKRWNKTHGTAQHVAKKDASRSASAPEANAAIAASSLIPSFDDWTGN